MRISHNDVKVDVEREICVITREGASNRKNGFVLVDCSNPRNVKIISTFDDGLWGGVHNVFVWNKRVFATNAGRRFDIINIEDPAKPWREGVFELDTPGHGIHDMWVVDGIAYASQWQDGIILVDVGNGIAGGSPSHPVKISSYAYPIGATHSAFPYQARNGKFYVFVGDEQFPYNLPLEGPDEAGGYIHIVDFTDLKAPKEVGRYQIPEAGPHNFWIQNDTMYVAYYNAGLRVVDVSGELMGNLYDQGRELARFFPEAAELDENLSSKNVNKFYDHPLMLDVGERLLRRPGVIWEYYNKSDVEKLMAEVEAAPSLPSNP